MGSVLSVLLCAKGLETTIAAEAPPPPYPQSVKSAQSAVKTGSRPYRGGNSKSALVLVRESTR